MKIVKYIWILFIVCLYLLNYYYLKINMWTYTGMVLGLLVILIVSINIIIKIKNRKGKSDDDFIFSSRTAEAMKLVDISTQYEASILSLFCLIIGMLLFTIYVFFIAPYTWLMRIFISFNTLCGIILMLSMLITNYQQYISHKESRRLIEDFANQFSPKDIGTEILSPEKMKAGNVLVPLELTPMEPLPSEMPLEMPLEISSIKEKTNKKEKEKPNKEEKINTKRNSKAKTEKGQVKTEKGQIPKINNHNITRRLDI
jgi:hypothetical protein